MISTQQNKFFRGCLKLKLKVSDQIITRSDILKGLKTILNEEERKSVDYVSSYGSCYRWMIGINNERVRRGCFGRKIKILDQECVLTDAESNDLIKTLRIFWLPKHFPVTIITDKIKKYGEIVETIVEESSDEGFENLRTGNLKIKVLVSQDKVENLKELVGIKKYQDIRFLVQLSGERPGCFMCGDNSHMKKDCPKLNLVCTKCKGRGHTTAECTMANRIKAKNKIHNFEDDYEYIDQSAENIITQETSTVTSTITTTNTEHYKAVFPTISEGTSQTPRNSRKKAITSTPINQEQTKHSEVDRKKNTRAHHDVEPSPPSINKEPDQKKKQDEKEYLDYSSSSSSS
jgi:hypothetical protein